VHVPVLCGKALMPIEVIPNLVNDSLLGFSFRSSTKTYMIPARFESKILTNLKQAAESVHADFGCRGLTRSDFRLALDGSIHFLELNTQHSIRKSSMALQSSMACGLSPLNVIERILADRWIPEQDMT